jgi:DNA ligase (NAD+)
MPKVVEIPTVCPSCGTPVERDEEEVAIYCPNVLCPDRQLEAIVHFASRGAMDIRGLSYARIEQLIAAGFVHDVADLYDLTSEQLTSLERFADKSADNLIDAITASKQQPLSRVMFGLGIRHVGQTAAQLLARPFGNMDALSKATAEDILALRGIGETIAVAVVAYFHDPSAATLVTKLAAHGLTLSEPVSVAVGGKFKGMTFVVTGTLPTLSRGDATALIESQGGRVTSGVSKATTAVVVGEEAGSKLEKARTLGIETIDEAELLRRAGPA